MKYPKFLKDNGTIGVCAPSFGATIEPYVSRLNNAIKTFEGMGHKVVLTDSVRKLKKARSASGKIRAKEFMQLYESDNVDVVISEAGGELMCEILDYLNFDKISKMNNPKWFLGFSDNTILTFLLTTIADIASIYGICFPEFGMEAWHKTVRDTYLVLKGEKLEVKNLNKYEIQSLKREPGKELSGYNLTEKSIWSNLSKEDNFKVEGRVLVGCLDILTMLCGTKYDKVNEFVEKYKDEGIIWFVESCELNVFSQTRAFWQLKHAGWFKYAKAIIIGRPNVKEELFDVNYKEANYSELKDLGIPVVIDADFGHVAPIFPIISGGYAKVDYNKGKCKIKYLLK